MCKLKTNYRLFCSDGLIDFDLETVMNFSDFMHELSKESCRCTATVHLPGFSSDAVRLAVDLVRQAREVGPMGEGVVVEELMLAVVGPVLSSLGIACTAADSNNNNSESDPATGDLKQVTDLT